MKNFKKYESSNKGSPPKKRNQSQAQQSNKKSRRNTSWNGACAENMMTED